MPLTVAIVEDDPVTRETLAALVNAQPTLRCIRTFARAEDAIRGIAPLAPAVVLVDINLPGLNGIECVRRIRDSIAEAKILMVTTYEDTDLIFDSLRAGANGYLLKHTIPTELIPAIEAVHTGAAPMSVPVARKVVEFFHHLGARQPQSVTALTEREREVLALAAEGLRNKEISDKLGISLSTVRAHLEHVFEKLHVSSRTEAAKIWYRS